MAVSNQFKLLGQRRFLPFFLTQFLGAFNDNVFRNALVFLIAFQGMSLTALDSDVLINICTALFMLPFFRSSLAFRYYVLGNTASIGPVLFLFL